MSVAFIFIGVFIVLYVLSVNWRLLILAFTHPSMLVRFLSILVVLLCMKGCAREVLEEALGIPVEVLALRDDRALIDAISTSRIDYTTFSATAFAAAWRFCKCVEPIAAPRAADGSAGFRSVLISRYLGPGSLAALKNKTILIPGKHSFSGFLYPKAALISKGIDLGNTDWQVDDKSNMQSAMSAFSEGEGDAILGWIPEAVQEAGTSKRGTLHELKAEADDESAKFRILWQSDVLPHGPQVVRRGLPGEAKKIIRQILLGLREKNAKAYDAIEPGFGGGFQSVSVDDYKPLTRIL